jgi:hypothetical protein
MRKYRQNSILRDGFFPINGKLKRNEAGKYKLTHSPVIKKYHLKGTVYFIQSDTFNLLSGTLHVCSQTIICLLFAFFAILQG